MSFNINLADADADADATFIGKLVGDESGQALSNAGDVNGDGFADILIGAFGADGVSGSNFGESYLYFGSGDRPAR